MKRAIALIELIFSIVIIALVLTAVPNLISVANKSSKNAISQEAVSNAASHISMIMSQYWDENDTDPNIGNFVLKTDSNDSNFNPPEFNITTNNTTTSTSNSSSGGNGWNFPPMSMPGNAPMSMSGNGSSSLPSPFSFLPYVEINNMGGANTFIYTTRVGSYAASSRRFYIDTNGTILSATNIGSDSDDNNTPDDVDDYNGNTYTLITHAGQDANVSEGDYKDTLIDINTKVAYVNDNYTINSNTSNGATISYYPYQKVNQTTNVKLITVTLTSSNDPTKKIILKSFSCNIGSSELKERTF